jgi:hypothetical protein
MRLSSARRRAAARSTNAVSSSRAAFSNSALTKVGVGPRLLAVEHPRADGDRVEHQPRDVLAVGLALARQAHGRRVVHDEAVDPQAPVVRADLGEGERNGSFMISRSHATGAT